MDGLETTSKIEEKLCYKANIARIPLSGVMELLPLCNMDCKMCYIKLTNEQMNKCGRLRTADEWLDIAKQMKESGTLFILLTGGEILLYKEFEKLYKGLIELGMIVMLNTNGTLINEKIADMLASSKPRRVNITLYGGSNETYSKLCKNPKGYDQTIRGIKLLKSRNIDVKISVSLVKENMHDLPKLLEVANSLDTPINVDTYMHPKTKGIKGEFKFESRIEPKKVAEINNFIKQNTQTEEEFMRSKLNYLNTYELTKQTTPPDVLKLSCRAGKSSFYIDWQGNMSSCIFLDNHKIDVFENGFSKSWDYVVEESDKILFPSKCTSCDKRDVCQVCPAAALSENKTMDKSPSYLCELTSEFINILEQN